MGVHEIAAADYVPRDRLHLHAANGCAAASPQLNRNAKTTMSSADALVRAGSPRPPVQLDAPRHFRGSACAQTVRAMTVSPEFASKIAFAALGGHGIT